MRPSWVTPETNCLSFHGAKTAELAEQFVMSKESGLTISTDKRPYWTCSLASSDNRELALLRMLGQHAMRLR